MNDTIFRILNNNIYDKLQGIVKDTQIKNNMDTFKDT